MQRQVRPTEVEGGFLEAIKAELFQEEKDKLIITRNLNNFDSALKKLLLQGDENDLQKKMAPLLRKYTLKHFRNPRIPYSQNFATTYEEILAQTANPAEAQLPRLDAYFSEQERAGAWATDVVAGALADLFDVSLVVTPFIATRNSEGLIIEDSVREQSTFTIKQSANPGRPIMNLYVINNTHWYHNRHKRGDTIGDGNCFYNAFALVCRQIILLEQCRPNDPLSSLSEEQRLAYEEQQRLLTLITKAPAMPMDELIKNIRSSLTQTEMPDHFASLSVAVNDKSDADEPGYTHELTQLQRQIDNLHEGEIKNRALRLLKQVRGISEPSPLLLEVVQATNSILSEASADTITAYQKLAAQVEGQASFKMKVLGGFMMALAVTLGVVCELALAGTLLLGLPVTIAVASVAAVSVAVGAGFFAYSGRSGLAKATAELISAVGPQESVLRRG